MKAGSDQQERPLVAVTGAGGWLPFGWWAARWLLRRNGLNTCYLTPHSRELPRPVQGVVIGGGDDIEPHHYGLTDDAGFKVNPARDRLEMEVLRSAIAARVPVFGICRGCQLINVVLGGTLFADIRPMRRHTPNKVTLLPVKSASIEPGSRLADILDVEHCRVNSLHKQAVDRPGDAVRVSARDEDDFVQAIEYRGDHFVVGVQWHPEYMPYAAVQRRLFEGFAREVRQSGRVLRLI